MARPRPVVVDPPPQALPVLAPPGRGGRSSTARASPSGGAPTAGPRKWVVKDGAIESRAGQRLRPSARGFGDCSSTSSGPRPCPPRATSQGRGNSGVFLMGLVRGAGARLLRERDLRRRRGRLRSTAQYPPLVNACRPPGEWQTYDIVFRRPRFRPTARLASPARITVLHNGVLVQNNVEPCGPTAWLEAPPYTPHPEKRPLALQDHGNPVRYRNIWVRELPEGPRPPAPLATPPGW